MSWESPSAANILGSNYLQVVSQRDLVPEDRDLAGHSWIVKDGAVLLKNCYESYHGDRSRFSSIRAYEVAVNGRGIFDLDLPGEGGNHIIPLIRRGVAGAWMSLYQQFKELPELRVAAYVSVAPILMDPSCFTGNVTFCSEPKGQEPYINPARIRDDITVALFTEDCKIALPEK